MCWLGLSLIIGSFIGYAYLPSIYVTTPPAAQLLFVLDVSRTSIVLSWLLSIFLLATWVRGFLKRPKVEHAGLSSHYFSVPLGTVVTVIMFSLVMTFEHPISAIVASR